MYSTYSIYVYCTSGPLVSVGLIGIPNTRGKVIALNSQNQDEIQCGGAWTAWDLESLD